MTKRETINDLMVIPQKIIDDVVIRAMYISTYIDEENEENIYNDQKIRSLVKKDAKEIVELMKKYYSEG